MGANVGQWEAGTKACCEQSCTESSEFQMLWVCKSRDPWGASGNSPGSVSWGLPLVCTIAERQIPLLGWLYFCSTELFAFKQPAWEWKQSCLSGARRGKRPLVSCDPAPPSQGSRGTKYCQCLVRAPTVTELQVCFCSSWTVLSIFLHRWKKKSTMKSAGPVLWSNCTCSRFCTLVTIWSGFLGFIWALRF